MSSLRCSVLMSRWLSLRTELLAQLLVLAASLGAVLGRDHLSPGLAGLAVSLALSITETFNCLLVALTGLENQAVVVERVGELGSVPQEPGRAGQGRQRLAGPGSLAWHNYTTPFLRGVDLEVEAGERVAVVGRSGAGKSSLALSCLGVTTPSAGQLTLDGADIGGLDLAGLRRAVVLVAQEPVLLRGSLRYNLDPAGECGEVELLQLLQLAGLAGLGLDTQLGESGSTSLSLGERQLVCLVRALARRPTVLILDEATASLDTETEARVTALLRARMAGVTVLAIAHRLHTVLDYDRVVVMEAGAVVEVGNPASLAANHESKFYKLLSSTQ